MSIGIALTLPDGVFLAADSRTTKPLVEAEPEDNADKIQPLDPSNYAIPFGIVQATDVALSALRIEQPEVSDPETFGRILELAVSTGWNVVRRAFGADVDQAHRSMKVALIAGGLLNGSAYIAASLHGTGVSQPPILVVDKPYKFIVLGGEEQGAKEDFRNRVSRIANHTSYDVERGPTNPFIKGLVSAAERTVRKVEKINKEIGGPVRYVVVRKGFPPFRAVLQGSA